jgi:hypothetical protein
LKKVLGLVFVALLASSPIGTLAANVSSPTQKLMSKLAISAHPLEKFRTPISAWHF